MKSYLGILGFFIFLFTACPVFAQLNLQNEKKFFAGQNILKVETTFDGYIWVLGEGNFIARISPEDVVEDFTDLFASHSTKPFTDISSRRADTLLLGTDGDYAFIFTRGELVQYGASQGLEEATITSVMIEKQYYSQYYPSFLEEIPPIAITTPNHSYGLNNDWQPYNRNFRDKEGMLFRQNDRKFLTYSLFQGQDNWSSCYGPGVGNLDLNVRYNEGITVRQAPMDVFSASADSLNAVYVTSHGAEMVVHDDFAIFWAGKKGLNYLFNTRDCSSPSRPIHFFDDKVVQSINELHLLAAMEREYLSYMLIGTTKGLYVSNESQKQQSITQYSLSELGAIAINDMEFTSTGVPAGVNTDKPDYPFCEQRLYVGTSDGLFKMGYTIEAMAYKHLGNALYVNENEIAGDSVAVCGRGDDVLSVLFNENEGNFIQWQYDRRDIVGANKHEINLEKPGTYRALLRFDCEGIEVYSREIKVGFVDTLAFEFDHPDQIKLCFGEETTLEVKGGPELNYQWYRNGEILVAETASQLKVKESGKYHVGVNACGDFYVPSDVVEVIVSTEDLDNLLRSGQGHSAFSGISDTVICVEQQEVLRIQAPIGFVSYSWNGERSQQSFYDIKTAGTYTLMVEDAQGCTGNVSFEVLLFCGKSGIPNTFSPNGDGINDVWTINDLEGDQEVVIMVFDRNGREVFHSRGYGMPWDGSFRGRLVPIGAYYYSIRTTEGTHYKGSVMVLY